MTVFQNVLDLFYGTGVLDTDDWGSVTGYTLLTRFLAEAIGGPKSAACWKGITSADNSVFVEIGETDTPSSPFGLLYRLTDPAGTPTGYMMKFEPLAGDLVARLYLLSDTTTAIAGPVTISAGVTAWTPGDQLGVTFTGDQHQIYYKPNGGASTLKGTLTDATITSAGFFGMANGDNI